MEARRRERWVARGKEVSGGGVVVGGVIGGDWPVLGVSGGYRQISADIGRYRRVVEERWGSGLGVWELVVRVWGGRVVR